VVNEYARTVGCNQVGSRHAFPTRVMAIDSRYRAHALEAMVWQHPQPKIPVHRKVIALGNNTISNCRSPHECRRLHYEVSEPQQLAVKGRRPYQLKKKAFGIYERGVTVHDIGARVLLERCYGSFDCPHVEEGIVRVEPSDYLASRVPKRSIDGGRLTCILLSNPPYGAGRSLEY